MTQAVSYIPFLQEYTKLTEAESLHEMGIAAESIRNASLSQIISPHNQGPGGIVAEYVSSITGTLLNRALTAAQQLKIVSNEILISPICQKKINKIIRLLDQPCPYWKDRKLKDYPAALVFESENSEYAELQELKKRHKEAGRIGISHISGVEDLPLVGTAKKVYLVILTPSVIPGSENLNYQDQLELLQNGYEAPSRKDAAYVLLSHQLSTNERLFSAACTRCRETVHTWYRATVGDFGLDGLNVGFAKNDALPQLESSLVDPAGMTSKERHMEQLQKKMLQFFRDLRAHAFQLEKETLEEEKLQNRVDKENPIGLAGIFRIYLGEWKRADLPSPN